MSFLARALRAAPQTRKYVSMHSVQKPYPVAVGFLEAWTAGSAAMRSAAPYPRRTTVRAASSAPQPAVEGSSVPSRLIRGMEVVLRRRKPAVGMAEALIHDCETWGLLVEAQVVYNHLLLSGVGPQLPLRMYKHMAALVARMDGPEAAGYVRLDAIESGLAFSEEDLASILDEVVPQPTTPDVDTAPPVPTPTPPTPAIDADEDVAESLEEEEDEEEDEEAGEEHILDEVVDLPKWSVALKQLAAIRSALDSGDAEAAAVEAEAWLATASPDEPVAMIFGALVAASTELKQPARVRDVLLDLQSRKFPRTASLAPAALTLAGSCFDRAAEAVLTLRQIQSAGIHTDAPAYEALISSLLLVASEADEHGRRTRESFAAELYLEMRSHGLRPTAADTNAPADLLRSMLHLAGRIDDSRLASRVHRDIGAALRGKAPQGSLTTEDWASSHTVLVRACARSGNSQLAVAMLGAMAREGFFDRDGVTELFAAVMDGLVAEAADRDASIAAELAIRVAMMASRAAKDNPDTCLPFVGAVVPGCLNTLAEAQMPFMAIPLLDSVPAGSVGGWHSGAEAPSWPSADVCRAATRDVRRVANVARFVPLHAPIHLESLSALDSDKSAPPSPLSVLMGQAGPRLVVAMWSSVRRMEAPVPLDTLPRIVDAAASLEDTDSLDVVLGGLHIYAEHAAVTQSPDVYRALHGIASFFGAQEDAERKLVASYMCNRAASQLTTRPEDEVLLG